MPLSSDSIIAIIGVIVTLPPSALLVCQAIRRRRSQRDQPALHPYSEDRERLSPTSITRQASLPYELVPMVPTTQVVTGMPESRQSSLPSLETRADGFEPNAIYTMPRDAASSHLSVPPQRTDLRIHLAFDLWQMSQIYPADMV
ncbi:hypothetical protein EDD36DRAFT_73303 [Exophiala viscosa]|uniref:Uncharacterized protein n=1 Tax=Exophiala viscosa TaxID=2486360 RepID=A0AAN6DQR8_9EURO|nr:hypothetical protein EDD36DRAFT_73303 [Exophiala viscosa]